MYGMERRVLLRDYLEQGWSKRALSERQGISGRTLYHWITAGQLNRDADDEAVRHKARAPPLSARLTPTGRSSRRGCRLIRC
jgi:transposase